MGWNRPGASDESDVVDVDTIGRRRLPRWVIPIVVALVLAVIVASLIVRQLGDDLTATAAEPRFPDRYTVVVDMTATNHREDEQGFVLGAPKLPGLRLVGVGDPSHPQPPDTIMFVPGRGTLMVSARWEVVDCAAAVTSGDHASVVRLTSSSIAAPHSFPGVRLPVLRELLPPVCHEQPGHGVAGLADLSIGRSERAGTVAVRLQIENTGGRALAFVGTGSQLAAGMPWYAVSQPSDDRLIDVGGRIAMTLEFRAHACVGAPRGPAEVGLRFDWPQGAAGDSRTDESRQTLTVHLADSWAALLGTCTSPVPRR